MKRIVLTPTYDLIGKGGQAKHRSYCSSLMVLSLTLFIFHLLSSSAMAQTTTSTIEGTVKDSNGAVISGADVKASGTTLAAARSATTDAEGFYRLAAIPAGTYVLTISRAGFATSTSNVELTLNRVVTFDIKLQVGNAVQEVVNVNEDVLPLLEPNESSTGQTITPRQIVELPVNGRDYLDLLQLVPGVAINRQADPGSDKSTPVLGERAGNNNFLIDGHPNKDTVNGGPAAQFNQETIAEFQVLTTGYKAEFGQASGAIVNVITKTGGNSFHGVASLFHRNDAFDTSNSLGTAKKDAPPLRRFDYSLALGGRLIKDKVFFFGSSERITENRRLDFKFPDTGSALVNQLLRNQETPFDTPTRSFETRNFFKLNEQLGRHQLTQEVNYTNGVVRNFLPLSASQSLPSARNDSGERHLLLAFGDTILLGEQSNPWILTLRGAYRGEPSDIRPSHPDAGAGTRFNPFSSNGCCFFFPGDLPAVDFGNPLTASNLDQKYTSFTANANKLFGDHDLKFGWNFLRTKVDGVEAQVLQNQLFTTVADFATFGPINAGIALLGASGGLTPAANEIHLRNNYNALFVQDDWKLRSNLTVNLGLRWDHDSEFLAKRNFSPRLGVAWSVTPKTVVRANFGVFYDQFRLGLARDVPAFGGADRRTSQVLLFPRGLYGSPSFLSSIALLFGLPGGCFSNGFVGNLTDAQITAAGLTCPLAPGLPFIGVDRLNRVVAPGHAPIPANAVINVSNVQALTGLTPDQYAAQASAAIGQPAGYFVFGPFGVLNNPIIPPANFPVRIDGSFKTPHTLAFSAGVQREIGKDMVVEVDYHHRDIRNLLGTRSSNLAFKSRVTGRSFLTSEGEINTFGPFFKGTYDALILNFNKRFSRRFLLGANYTFANATDNSLGIFARPSDSFIGIVPEVTEPSTGRSNRDGSFITAPPNPHFVAQAGTFLNGPDLDKGPSDLAVDHIFQINGLVEFPWQIQVSGIFRTQSGFHFSRTDPKLSDPDGDGATNGIDLGPGAGRNAFTAPPFVNLDLRLAKRFSLGERVKVQVLFEFFNLLNHQNPADVGRKQGIALEPFGSKTQVLPGREGQIGFRIEF
ncbi:MAG: TonB-dependent receptor [Acidobacteriota bacterium]|nr:TonB-dependent receptor [Acidobacteriota bacterium]